MGELRSRLVVVCALAGLLAGAGAAQAQTFETGKIEKCNGTVPLPGVMALPASEPVVDIHLHVVLDDGVTLTEGRQAVTAANLAYRPIGLRLVPSFTTATMHGNYIDELFAELKSLFGGVRPPWAHAVYLLTKRDIAHPIYGAGVAGVVDCHSGIPFPDRAFGMGEANEDTGLAFEVPMLWDNMTGKVLGHELGHLFGAHHDYSNCVEAPPTDGAAEPCTLMSRDISLAHLKFETLNASVMRGHALTYLAPITTTPPPDGSPTPPPAPVTDCHLKVYDDRAGDSFPVEAAANPDADLLEGAFRVDAGQTFFRWKVAELDGELTVPGDVRFKLHISAPRPLDVVVTWNGQSPPAAVVRGPGGAVVTTLKATIAPGPGGIVEVALPLDKLGLGDGTMTLGELGADTVDAAYVISPDDDTADPLVYRVRPSACL